MKQYTTYHPSPLGTILIQCTDTDIQRVNFTEETGASDEHYLLTKCCQQLDEYFKGNRVRFDLPLQQNGTEFQLKVWELLSTVPFGKTISYNDLSKMYGDVKAIRAIAAANGKNKICIIVPCHRIVGSDQSLVGYVGGLWRKKWLLEHEIKIHSGVQQLTFID